jgi:hypothetical protein
MDIVVDGKRVRYLFCDSLKRGTVNLLQVGFPIMYFELISRALRLRHGCLIPAHMLATLVIPQALPRSSTHNQHTAAAGNHISHKISRRNLAVIRYRCVYEIGTLLKASMTIPLIEHPSDREDGCGFFCLSE